MRSLLATFVLVLASSSVGCADEAGDLPAPTAGGTAPGNDPGPDGGVADARALEGGARDDASRPSKPSGPPKTDGTFARKTGLSYPQGSPAIDLWVPNGSGPFPVVLYVHGGAWLEGDRGEAAPIAPRLASRGYVVASIDYRLSGAARFPAQIQDAKAAVRWLRAHAGDYDLDEGRIAAWGSSAGAHLAALLGTSGGVAALEDLAQGGFARSSRVQAVVDWYGPTDFRQMDAQTVPGCQNANHDGKGLRRVCARRLRHPGQGVRCQGRRSGPHRLRRFQRPTLLMHGTQDAAVPTEPRAGSSTPRSAGREHRRRSSW